jgi:H+/gluconate symporter-like permease
MIAAFLPGSLALIQGLSQDTGCHNITNPSTNQTQLVPKPFDLNYSVDVYFGLICILLCISFTSYVLLNCLKVSKDAQKPKSIILKHIDGEQVNFIQSNGSKNRDNEDENGVEFNKLSKNEKIEIVTMMVLIFFVTFVWYGVLPGLSTYATLPYGNKTFSYSINLSEFVQFKKRVDL